MVTAVPKDGLEHSTRLHSVLYNVLLSRHYSHIHLLAAGSSVKKRMFSALRSFPSSLLLWLFVAKYLTYQLEQENWWLTGNTLL